MEDLPAARGGGTDPLGVGRVGLDPRWRLLPAGGSSNIPAFVALVGPHLDVTVLADTGSTSMQRLEALQKAGLVKNQRLVTVAEITGGGPADIEDLFAVPDYLALFNGAFGKTLKEKELPPGDRVLKRIERVLDGAFDHRQPSDYLLWNREAVLATLRNHTLDLFERLNDTLSRRGRGPSGLTP